MSAPAIRNKTKIKTNPSDIPDRSRDQKTCARIFRQSARGIADRIRLTPSQLRARRQPSML
jgi:hypothetical protein